VFVVATKVMRTACLLDAEFCYEFPHLVPSYRIFSKVFRYENSFSRGDCRRARLCAAENVARGHKVCIKLEIQFADGPLPSRRDYSLARRSNSHDYVRILRRRSCTNSSLSLPLSLCGQSCMFRCRVYWPLIMFHESSSRITER